LIRTIRRAGLALVALGAIAPAAQAATAVETQSALYVERIEPGNTRRLQPADSFRPGERVVTILTWERRAGSGGFVITNPLPRAITYQQSARDSEEVSVDGGRSWGQLGQLVIGSRLAAPEDVTHVRWRVPPAVAAQGRGRIAYSGIVRR
jgi:hypothetical protein